MAPTAADLLRPLLYGDQPLNGWPRLGEAAHEEPWASFVRARQLLQGGNKQAAVAIWSNIAGQHDLESRHILQAWHFLRAEGVGPAGEDSSAVLAAVAEVSVDSGHDLLVAYRDGGVRYLNRSGKVAVVEGDGGPALRDATSQWLAVADQLASAVGVWEEPQLPPLPSDHSRIMMLTPAGPRFGQGPDTLLRQGDAAAAFLSAATTLLVVVTHLPLEALG